MIISAYSVIGWRIIKECEPCFELLALFISGSSDVNIVAEAEEDGEMT
jgi:hypothetical protein